MGGIRGTLTTRALIIEASSDDEYILVGVFDFDLTAAEFGHCQHSDRRNEKNDFFVAILITGAYKPTVTFPVNAAEGHEYPPKKRLQKLTAF
jgi:hypothetical protein